jgi:ABC-type transporter MlaC component
MAALLLLLAALLPTVARADDADTTVRDLIARTSSGLDDLYRSNRISDRAAVEQLISREIMPAVDGERLTKRVFRHYWRRLVEAGKQQEAQQRVLDSLRRTYAVALSNYAGDKLSVVDINTRKSSTVARTRIRRPNGQTIQVDFSLNQHADGRWLIDDMAVDGIRVSLTLFNAMKPVWDAQGIDAALNSIATASVSGADGTVANPDAGARSDGN